MAFLDKLRNRIKELEVAAKDIARGELAPEEVQKARLDTCEGCVHLFKPTGNCKRCGCFVKIKTQLLHSKCPVGKW